MRITLSTLPVWAVLGLAAIAALLAGPSPARGATAEDCATCHEDVVKSFAVTQHGRSFKTDREYASATCESCHGPGDRHMESGDPADILNPVKLEGARADAACLTCHGKKPAQSSWHGGEHRAAGVNCVDCHSAHHTVPPRREIKLLRSTGLTRTTATTDLCLSCHTEVRGKLYRTSHHPVLEGRMDCASCHDPHGSKPALLRANSVSEACISCHTEKRGPYLWEHAPVRESCSTCHDPHGSNNRQLLAKKDSFLCLQCHSYGGHINLPRYNRTSNPYGQGCVNCHITVHGSNHPSGAKLTR